MNTVNPSSTDLCRQSDIDACKKAINDAIDDGTYCLGITGICKNDSILMCTNLGKWMMNTFGFDGICTVSPPFDTDVSELVKACRGTEKLVMGLDIDLMDSDKRDVLLTLPENGVFLLYAASVPYSYARTYELRPLNAKQSLMGISGLIKNRFDETDIPEKGIPDTDYYFSLMKKNMNNVHYLHSTNILDDWEDICYDCIPEECIERIDGYLSKLSISKEQMLPLLSVLLYTSDIKDDFIDRFIPMCTPAILPLINLGIIEHKNNSVRTIRTNRVIIRRYMANHGYDSIPYLYRLILNINGADLNNDVDARRCIIGSYRNILNVGLNILKDDRIKERLKSYVDKIVMKLINANILICSYEDVDCIQSLLDYYIDRSREVDNGHVKYRPQIMSMLGMVISLTGLTMNVRKSLFDVNLLYKGPVFPYNSVLSTASTDPDTDNFRTLQIHRACCNLYFPDDSVIEKIIEHPSNFINFLYLHNYRRPNGDETSVLERIKKLNEYRKLKLEKCENRICETDGSEYDDRTENESEKRLALMKCSINQFICRIQISRIMHMSHIYSRYSNVKCLNSDETVKDGLRKYIYGGLSQYYDIRDSGLMTLPEDYETSILTEMAEDLIASEEYMDASNILDKLKNDYSRCRPVYRARIDQCRGTFCFRMRNYSEAMEAYESARRIYREIDDTTELYLLNIKLLNVRISADIHDNEDLIKEINSVSDGFSKWFPEVRDEAEYLLAQIML